MKYLTIGQLAKQANLTVRTLQFYDQIGILKPTTFSEGGRRLYQEDDIITLHQIITLKNLGLSLKDIGKRLIPIHKDQDVITMLTKQSDLIRNQIDKSSKILDSIEMLRSQIESGQGVDWTKYATMVSLIGDNNENYWLMNYLEEDLLKDIVDSHEMFDEKTLPTDWFIQSMKRAQALAKDHEDPMGPSGQALAKEIWAILKTYAKGQELGLERLYQFFMRAEDWPKEFSLLQAESHTFIEAAIGQYVKTLSGEVAMKKE